MLVCFPRPRKRAVKRLLRAQLPAVLVLTALSGIGPAASVAAAQGFRVYVNNDLPEPVIVRSCDDYCSSSALDVVLVAGAKVALTRTVNNHDYLSVTTVAGAHLGCIDLFFASAQPGAKIPVSGTVSCPTSQSTKRLLIIGIAVVALVGVGLLMLRPRFSR